ncbi:MAG TPA: MDR family MFS transporter [Stellaceae bacterium]|nr:MDR family MFS transporter [Stellaceae bacterium]
MADKAETAHDGLSAAAPRGRGYILAACMMAQFMAAVEATIVGTAMPTIVADLGGFHLFSWVFASYLLAQAASTPIYGRLADVYGRKRVFIFGASLFLVASTACGFAWGMVPLIVLRMIQGFGSGAIQPIAWTILGDVYPPRERAMVQGWLSAVFGTSAIAGPLLGGFIVEHLHWALVFWINIPVSIATMAMLSIFLKEKLVARRHDIDYLGALLLMIGIGALMVVLVQARSLDRGLLIGLSALAIVALAALVWQEAHTREPIVPYKLWRLPIIVAGNIGSFAIGALMMANGAFLPTYVQGAMGASPAIAGLTLGASSILWTFGTFGAGRVMVRISYRAAALLGGVIMVVGAALLLTATPDDGPAWVGFAAAVLGLGMGFSNTTFVIATQTSVGWSERGAATSANMFLRTVGQSVGTALFGAVFNLGVGGRIAGADEEINRLLEPATRATLGAAEVMRLSDAIAAAIHNVYLISAVLAVVLLGLAFRIPAGLSPVRQPVPSEAPRPVAGE